MFVKWLFSKQIKLFKQDGFESELLCNKKQFYNL